VLRPGAGRFALGPLTEVAASTHTWEELAPHLASDSPLAGTVAQERVLRGEDLRGDPRANPDVLELPLALAAWEPSYPLPSYRGGGMVVPEPPDLPEPAATEPGDQAAQIVVRPVVVRALLDLVEVWTSESSGEAAAAVVRGGPADALARLGVEHPRLVRIGLAEALAWMAWAASSGGAHGVRRGAALGRFDAWWAAAALAGSEWPPEAGELGAALGRLDWWAWDDGVPATGWVLRLAAADPDAGWAAALDARDTSTDPGRRMASSSAVQAATPWHTGEPRPDEEV
jgi:resuscitation-promoting factor RpfA